MDLSIGDVSVLVACCEIQLDLTVHISVTVFGCQVILVIIKTMVYVRLLLTGFLNGDLGESHLSQQLVLGKLGSPLVALSLIKKMT